jgi:hypothetical protein
MRRNTPPSKINLQALPEPGPEWAEKMADALSDKTPTPDPEESSNKQRKFSEARALANVIQARLAAEIDTWEQWETIARQAEQLARHCRIAAPTRRPFSK